MSRFETAVGILLIGTMIALFTVTAIELNGSQAVIQKVITDLGVVK